MGGSFFLFSDLSFFSQFHMNRIDVFSQVSVSINGGTHFVYSWAPIFCSHSLSALDPPLHLVLLVASVSGRVLFWGSLFSWALYFPFINKPKRLIQLNQFNDHFIQAATYSHRKFSISTPILGSDCSRSLRICSHPELKMTPCTWIQELESLGRDVIRALLLHFWSTCDKLQSNLLQTRRSYSYSQLQPG